MKLGIGKAIITPPLGTPLAGFSSRDHGAEGVLDDLGARTLWFQDGDSAGGAVCIITADLVCFGPTMTAFFRNTLQDKYGLPPERLLLAASHTHSGPQVDEGVIGAGETVPEVRDMVRHRIMESVADARSSLRPITLHAGKGICSGFAINRRLLVNGEYIMAPNPDGVRDDQVTVISCRDAEDGKVRAALFHFTCHPSTMSDYNVSADYSGAAGRYAEQLMGDGAVAAFLPGCFGDIRSNCTFMGGFRFRGGLPMDLTLYGEALGGEVARVVEQESKPVTPRLFGRLLTVDLPLSGHPSREELEGLLETGNALEKEWAEVLLSGPFTTSRPFDIQRIDLAEEVSLVALSGEVCVEYGLFTKSLRPDAYMVPMGYSNAVTAYIPTAEMFPQGGYEPERSCPYYILPAPFKPEIEEIIKEGIRRVVSES